MASLLGLMALLAACGGGGGSSSGGTTPPPPPPSVTLSSIAVAPSAATVPAGLTQQFTATGTYSDGSTKDLTSSATWSSSDISKATIASTSGLATGKSVGTTTITATYTNASGGNVSGSNTLTVAPPNLSSVTVSSAAPSVAAGLTVQFAATGSYTDGSMKDLTASVSWSSDSGNATIAASTGLATGVAAGTATITATISDPTAGTLKGSNTLTVAPPNLLSMVISPNGPSVPVMRKVQFHVFGKYTDGKDRELGQGISWSSSDTSIATIDSTTGEATALNSLGNTNISASVAGGPAIAPVQMTVTATIYAYTTNFDDNTVSQYQLNQDGSLAPLTGKLSVPSNGTQPFSISVEPTGEYVYVANWATSTIAQYRIQSDGSLTSIGTGTVQVGLFPNSVTINHNDSFAYVASLGNNTISQFRIGLDGQLEALDTPTVASGSAPAAVVVDPTDRYAYVANYGQNAAEPPAGPGTISQYSIGSDGSLAPIGSGSVQSGQGPNALTIEHAGKFLYVANHGDGTAPGTVGQYQIGADGSLTAVATTNVGLRPVSIAIDKSNQFLYVANRTDGTISQFSINGTTGALTPLTPAVVAVGTNTEPSAVATDPTGKAVYVTDRSSNKVYQFEIDQTSGALSAYTSSPTVDSGLHPTAIATGY